MARSPEVLSQVLIHPEISQRIIQSARAPQDPLINQAGSTYWMSWDNANRFGKHQDGSLNRVQTPWIDAGDTKLSIRVQPEIGDYHAPSVLARVKDGEVVLFSFSPDRRRILGPDGSLVSVPAARGILGHIQKGLVQKQSQTNGK